MDAKEKTILVAGSTDGVGRRVAERLAAEGANGFVTDEVIVCDGGLRFSGSVQ